MRQIVRLASEYTTDQALLTVREHLSEGALVARVDQDRDITAGEREEGG